MVRHLPFAIRYSLFGSFSPFKPFKHSHLSHVALGSRPSLIPPIAPIPFQLSAFSFQLWILVILCFSSTKINSFALIPLPFLPSAISSIGPPRYQSAITSHDSVAIIDFSVQLFFRLAFGLSTLNHQLPSPSPKGMRPPALGCRGGRPQGPRLPRVNVSPNLIFNPNRGCATLPPLQTLQTLQTISFPLFSRVLCG